MLENHLAAGEVAQSQQLTQEEIIQAMEETRKRAEELRLSLQPTAGSKWRKYLFNALILGLLFYSTTQSSSSPQPQQASGKPQYWHN